MSDITPVLNAESLGSCWEINGRWPKFCASLANGHGRCRKGTCSVVESRQAMLFDRERTDGD